MQPMRKLIPLGLGLAAALALVLGSNKPASSDSGAVSVGSGIRYICQTTAPAPVGRARSWVRCSDGHFIFTTAANVDKDLTP